MTGGGPPERRRQDDRQRGRPGAGRRDGRGQVADRSRRPPGRCRPRASRRRRRRPPPGCSARSRRPGPSRCARPTACPTTPTAPSCPPRRSRQASGGTCRPDGRCSPSRRSGPAAAVPEYATSCSVTLAWADEAHGHRGTRIAGRGHPLEHLGVGPGARQPRVDRGPSGRGRTGHRRVRGEHEHADRHRPGPRQAR